MILAQPVLTLLLTGLVILYFAKLRSRASDVSVVLVCFAFSILLIFRPDLATRLANAFGIGRGVDLIIYLAIPGLAMLVLVLFARTREINLKLTAVLREMALNGAQTHTPEAEQE